MKSQFIKHLKQKYPSLAQESLDDLISENLISPHVVTLSAQTVQKMQTIIANIFNMRSQKKYLDYYSKELYQKNIFDPGNHSILMSYDFHLDQNGEPKLIEINTNASFLALGYEMYLYRNRPLPISHFQITDLRKNIENEMQLFEKGGGQKSSSSELKIAIVDENPQSQRLYVEFLLYQEIFKSWGWNSVILDYQSDNLNSDFDFVYNRSTDFYLADPSIENLRNLYKKRSLCLSPNPHEYFLVADKERLIDWSQPSFFREIELSLEAQKILENTILKSFPLNQETSQRAWSLRKQLFFKPKSSFGSKQAYKGASISQKVFEACVQDGNFLAQEICPAPEILVKTSQGIESFKYDLRFYAYEGQPQLILARLYQGQVTNLRTLGGGFAPVIVT